MSLEALAQFKQISRALIARARPGEERERAIKAMQDGCREIMSRMEEESGKRDAD